MGVREVEGGEKGDGEGEGVGEGEEERKGKGGRLKWRKDGCRKGGVCVCWGGGECVARAKDWGGVELWSKARGDSEFVKTIKFSVNKINYPKIIIFAL